MAAMRGPSGIGGELDEALVRAGCYLRKGVVSADMRMLQKSGGREAGSFCRDRWSYDKPVRSTHGVNCTGSCSWKAYVKDGIITWEAQQTDYPSAGPDRPDYAPRGAAFSWYTYSPARIRYPYVRGVLLELFRGARARHGGDPVEAWAEITGNPGLARGYKSACGKGGFVRASWEEAVELAAAAHVHTIRTWGPDRIAGLSPIPAMSMVSHAAGARFRALIGTPMLSFYHWYADLPVASPQVFGDQTDVPESGDGRDASYLVLWGSNAARRSGRLITILGRMVSTMGTSAAGGQARSLSRTAMAIRDLYPGYFAFVMATGIISTGTFLLGPSWLSKGLLVVASIGFVVLSTALVVRLAVFRSSVAADIQAPERVFGFFTIVAGIDVLGVRLGAAGHPLTTAILAGVAAVVWLALTYGVPASLLLARERDSVLGGVNGTWLLWVVGTQSLSVTASALVPVWPSQSGLLAPAAVGLWSVGLVLYLLLVSLILLRWLTVAMTPATLGPPYWILMGATAITVLAGARILSLPAALPVTRATAGFIEGFSFTLWAFGTWWIPLLIVLGLWRHVRRHWPLTYEPALWSVVFPLGMYSVATLSFGKVAHLRFMEPLSRFMLWVAVAAWVVVAVAFLVRLARRSGEPASGAAAASASATTTAT
jgi:tellurite resistance protein TehA-like permease